MQGKSETNVSFGEKLAELIRGRGMNNVSMAKAIGVSHVAVGNYVKGRVPKAAILQRIADFFGVSSSVLLSQSDAIDQKLAARGHIDESGIISEAGIRYMYRTFHREIIRRTAIEVTKEDIKRGFVETRHLEFSDKDAERLFTYPVRIERLSPATAMRLAAQAVEEFDPEIFLDEALKVDFPDDTDRKEIVWSMSPFSLFAVVRASLILSLGEDVAHEMLVSLGYKYHLEELGEQTKGTANRVKP